MQPCREPHPQDRQIAKYATYGAIPSHSAGKAQERNRKNGSTRSKENKGNNKSKENMNKPLTDFINNELYPLCWDKIPSIFPDMGFVLKRGKWCSRLHFDGTEATNPREDKSVITERYPHRVYDNGRQEHKSLIDVYMQLNSITSVWEAVKDICSIVGIAEPETTQEAREAYKKSEERRTILEASAERQQKALFSQDGASTLEYLHSRGWTDKMIKEAELGYISQAEASSIGEQNSRIGVYYTLSIPLRSGSRLYGFKFRTIQTGKSDNPKYIYQSGVDKRSNLFGLTGIQQKSGRIIVVEGELDALRAKVAGIEGVVATSGGALTNELLDAATQRGIRTVTLLLDKDSAGREFLIRSAKTAYRRNCISVLAAEFPEDGTKIHDVDEYLSVYTKEELESLISGAKAAWCYILENLIDEAKRENGGTAEIRDEVERKLTDKVIRAANEIQDETERCMMLKSYSDFVGGFISDEALIARANEARAYDNALLKRQRTEEASYRVSALLGEGRVDEALGVMTEAASSLKRIGTAEKYSALLAIPNKESFSQRIKRRQGEIYTSYEFKSLTGEIEGFSLPSGAITFIVAPTSHGKSTMLQNLALQVASNSADGITLYFTFEEDEESVTLQMLNKHIGVELCDNYGGKQSNNLRAINHYYKTGEKRYIKYDKQQAFTDGMDSFFSELYDSGKLRIYYEDYDSMELIEAIRYICTHTKVKAVFIDYIQLLSKNGNKKQRTEELKEICKDLKNLSIETQLPIVVAAQANREVTSPLEMHSQKIAEAADLERIANKILFIWNSSFAAQKSNDKKNELEVFENRTGIKLGTPGKIYAKLTKNRGGLVGVEAVLEYNGNTGVIEPNKATEQRTAEPHPQQTVIPF